MSVLTVKAVTAATSLAGPWVVRLSGWIVATLYFLFRPSRVSTSLSFYRALFPGRSRLFYFLTVWRQFHEFAASYADRVEFDLVGRLAFTSEGWEHLEAAVKAGQGGIILASHLGNWEIAARRLKRKGLDMTIWMGEKGDSAVDRFQKEDIRRTGLGVQVSQAAKKAPLKGFDVLSRLKNGELVALAGDVAWSEQRRRVPVAFLGHEVQLPAGPHQLALISGAPVLTAFCSRVGPKSHHFQILPPRWVKPTNPGERSLAIIRSAQQYADDLAKALERFPWQWGIFEPFLGPPLKEASSSKTWQKQSPDFLES